MSNLLLPQDIQHIKRLYQKRFVVVVLHALVVLVVIAGGCLSASYVYSTNEENVLLAKKAVLEKRETGELKQSLVMTITDINTRLSAFDGTSLSSPIIASFVDPIMKAKVASVYLTNLAYTADPNTTTARIVLSGVSTSRESILSFADNLRKTPGISAVDVPITNFIKESNMPFTITLTVTLQ